MGNVLKIVHTYDQNDCDHDGCSGGYAEGANVYLNDKLIYQFVPKAHCFGGDHMTSDILIKGILENCIKELNGNYVEVQVEEIYE